MTTIKNLPSWILSTDKKYEKYIKKPEPIVEKVEEAPPKLTKSISKKYTKYEYSDDEEDEEEIKKKKKVQPKKKAQPKKEKELSEEEEDEEEEDEEEDEEILKQKLKNLKNLKKYLKK